MRAPAVAFVASLLGLSVLSSCADERAAAAGEDIRFALVEEMRIDPYAHDLVPLNATRPLVVADDGTIAIAQPQDAMVRFFSPEGEPIGQLGRRGEGPGEFQSVWRLGWMGGDTLWIYDQGLRRFTLVDPDRNYVRYIYVPNGAHPGPDLQGRFPSFRTVFGGALYADGSVYGEMAGPTEPGFGEHVAGLQTYGRIADDGSILSYFQFPSGAGEPIMVQTAQGRVGLPGTIFPSFERPILRLADDGTMMAYLRVAIEGPDAGTFEIILEDVLANDTLYQRRYPYEPTPVTPAMADSIIDQMAENFPPEFAGPFRRGVSLPTELPPVAGMEMSSDGTLWVQMRDTEEGRPYRILDPRGEPVGMVTVPTNVRIIVTEEDRVWAIERDPFDVETVVRYRVEEMGEGI